MLTDHRNLNLPTPRVNQFIAQAGILIRDATCARYRHLTVRDAPQAATWRPQRLAVRGSKQSEDLPPTQQMSAYGRFRDPSACKGRDGARCIAGSGALISDEAPISDFEQRRRFVAAGHADWALVTEHLLMGRQR